MNFEHDFDLPITESHFMGLSYESPDQFTFTDYMKSEELTSPLLTSPDTEELSLLNRKLELVLTPPAPENCAVQSGVTLT